MKRKALAALFVASLCLGSASAEKGVVTGTQFGSGEDSIQCITNISLFVPYAKSGNYKDALEFWEKAFNSCPASTRDLYLYGVRIVGWQIQNEKDPAKKKALVDKLMNVYDQRIKYFGKDSKYPESWILGRKGIDLLVNDPTAIDQAYGILEKAVDLGKDDCEVTVLQYFVTLSAQLLAKNESHKEKFIADYLKATALLDNIASKGGKNGELALAAKTTCDDTFANSGAADCESIQRIFGPKIDQNKDNIDFLKNVIALMRRARCQEMDCYFTASDYAHKIQPTSESAIGLAKQAYKQDDTDLCLKYFEEAAQLAEQKDKAEIYYNMAAVNYKKDKFVKAREYALQAIENNPNYGAPYILIASMYASSARSIYPDDAIMSSCVYYLVVDKLNKAKSVDPSCEEEASTLIRTYSAHFPKKEDIFMKPELEMGKPVRIGGWIQESTTVR